MLKNIKILSYSILLITSLAFANEHSAVNIFTTKQAEQMEKDSKNAIKDISKSINIKNDFNKFNKNKLTDFEKLIQNGNKLQTLNFVEQVYQGTPFISKNEGIKLAEKIKQAKKYADSPKEFLLYFYSESVPKNSTLNILLNMDILRQNGINIESKQYMVGYPKNYKQYMFDWKDTIEEYPVKFRKMAMNNFHMKLDLGFFKKYNIKRVPAMALAVCKSGIPEPKSCKIKYLIRGDVPLVTFFDKIALEDKKYLKYSQALNANGIIDLKKIKSKEVSSNEDNKK